MGRFLDKPLTCSRDLLLQVALVGINHGEQRRGEKHSPIRDDEGENERLPTLLKRLKFLEEKLTIPPEQRIPDREN